MDREYVEDLKQRHKFEAWQGTTNLTEGLFIWQFQLNGVELSGWQAQRIQNEQAPDWPSFIQSIWRLAGEDDESLLGIDVYETESRSTAHQFLLQVLAEFESPDVVRLEEPVAGDVAFAAPGDQHMLFARANLVVMIRNAGPTMVPASESAQRFDAYLTARPMVEQDVAPAIRRFGTSAKEARVGVPMGLELEATDPLDRALWYKFFSASGEVLLEEGKLSYIPRESGSQVVTVFAINENLGSAESELQLTAT